MADKNSICVGDIVYYESHRTLKKEKYYTRVVKIEKHTDNLIWGSNWSSNVGDLTCNKDSRPHGYMPESLCFIYRSGSNNKEAIKAIENVLRGIR